MTEKAENLIVPFEPTKSNEQVMEAEIDPIQQKVEKITNHLFEFTQNANFLSRFNAEIFIVYDCFNKDVIDLREKYLTSMKLFFDIESELALISSLKSFATNYLYIESDLYSESYEDIQYDLKQSIPVAEEVMKKYSSLKELLSELKPSMETVKSHFSGLVIKQEVGLYFLFEGKMGLFSFSI